MCLQSFTQKLFFDWVFVLGWRLKNGKIGNLKSIRFENTQCLHNHQLAHFGGILADVS
jgi:hypothetical protein